MGRPWAAVDLDSGDVERERSKTQGGFTHIEAAQLPIENLLNDGRLGAVLVMLPPLADEAPEGEDEENPCATGRIEHLGSRFVLHGSEGLLYHQPGDRARRVMNASIVRSTWISAMAETLIDLTEHADRNMGEVELVPIQLQFWLKIAAYSVPSTQDG